MARSVDGIRNDRQRSEDEATADFVLRQQVLLLLRGFSSSAYGNLIAACALTVVLWSYLDHDRLLVWLFSLVAVITGRLWQARTLLAASAFPVDRQRLNRRLSMYTVGLAFTGLTWGVAGYLFIDPKLGETTVFTMMFVVGVSSTGSILNAAVPRSVPPFLILMLAPAAIRLSTAFDTQSLGLYLGGAVLIYLVMLLTVSRYGHRMLWHTITVGIENERLKSDIANEKLEAEKVRHEAELQYREIFDHMTDGLLLLDVLDNERFRVAGANPAMEQMTGISIDAVKGLQVEDAVGPIVAARAIENYRRCLLAGVPIRYEMSLPLPAGIVFFESVVVPLRRADGAIHRLIIISRDITKRKRLEEGIAIRERQFRTLIENSPEIVVRYGLDYRRIFTNPAYDKLIGVADGEAIGTELESCWRPENLTATDFKAVLQGLADGGGTHECLLEWHDESGKIVCLIYRLVAEYDLEGRIESILAFGHNISALRQQDLQDRVRTEILERLVQGADLSEVLTAIVLYLEQANPGLVGSIMLVDEKAKKLRVAAAPSLPTSFCQAVDGTAINGGVGGSGIPWNAEACVADLNQHPDWGIFRETAKQAGLHACWSFPIHDAAGQLLGVLATFRRNPGLPIASELESTRQSQHLAVIAIERSRIEKKLQHQATYDTLTGLPNRVLLNNRLAEEISKAARTGRSVGLLFIDLDRFKEVNDSLGHEAGDTLLAEAAARIRKCVRASDVVARLGGDEFVALLPDANGTSHLGRVAQSIVDTLALPFSLNGQEVFISTSVGIAYYPHDADNGSLLLACADQAMYDAKEKGRNGFCFFTESMQTIAEHRLRLSSDLRVAIAQEQMILHYQPIIDVATGRVEKAEALLRWIHPVLGLIPPAEFIEIAEETGLIHGIGDWVFQEAARTARDWLRQAPGSGQRLQIAINMSPRQFVRETGWSSWLSYLQSIDLDPQHIALEITEGLLLHERMNVADQLSRFRAEGIQISLDDFGTGYSAMAYLKKYPIDYLKIDRSFVRDLVTEADDQAIAEAMITMAHKLGLKTIAEGVESAEQRDMLAAFGCDLIQGHFYSFALPRDEFFAYLNATGSADRPRCADGAATPVSARADIQASGAPLRTVSN